VTVTARATSGVTGSVSFQVVPGAARKPVAFIVLRTLRHVRFGFRR